MATALIALGGNRGNVRETFRAALFRLADLGGVLIGPVSGLYRTAPVGGPEQSDFLNAAASLETRHAPAALLRRMLDVEMEFARERKVHWGPRTLDLDLLLMGDQVIDDPPRLILPHPRMAERRFVLVPLAEIAPEVVHPVTGRTIAAMLANVPAEPGDVELVERDWL